MATASGDDAKVWRLTRHAPAVGDSFHADVTTTIRHGTVDKPLKNFSSSKLAYSCMILSKNETTGGFEARLDMEPQVTTSEEDGVAQLATTRAVSIQQEMSAEELSVVPILKDKAGADLAAGRDQLKLGESWTCEKIVPVTTETTVPVTGTYTVSSFEKGSNGHDLVKIEFKSSGSAMVGGKTKLTVTSHGHALIDPTRAERPVDVGLFYRFVAEGDGTDGAAAVSETEVTIHTNEVTK